MWSIGARPVTRGLRKEVWRNKPYRSRFVPTRPFPTRFGTGAAPYVTVVRDPPRKSPKRTNQRSLGSSRYCPHVFFRRRAAHVTLLTCHRLRSSHGDANFLGN